MAGAAAQPWPGPLEGRGWHGKVLPEGGSSSMQGCTAQGAAFSCWGEEVLWDWQDWGFGCVLVAFPPWEEHSSDSSAPSAQLLSF